MKINKVEIFYALLLIITAFTLRVYDITNFPWGLHVDEVDKFLISLNADWLHPPAFFYGWRSGGRDIIFIYLLKFSREVLFGNTIFALRIVPIIIGTLAVLFYYLLNRQTQKKWQYAILTTLVLCFSLTHITFSRLVLRAILVPQFIFLIAFFLVKFINSKNTKYLLLYSLFLGLGIYTYYSFLAVIPIGILVLTFLVYKKIITLKLLMLLCFITILIISPMLKFWTNDENRNEYFRRSKGISITNPIWHHNSEKWLIKTVFYNSYVILNKLSINTYTNEINNYRYQIPYRGMIDPFIVTLFFTLLILFLKSTINKKDKVERVLLGLCILGASTLGAIITVDLRGYTIRLLPTFTFILIFLSYLIYFAQKNYKSKKLNIFIILMVSLSIVFNFYSTFVTLRHQWATHERFDEDYYNLGLIIKEKLKQNPNLVIYIPNGDERYKNMFYTNFDRQVLLKTDQYKVFKKIPRTEVDKIMVIRESDFNNKVNKYKEYKDRILNIEIIPKLRAYGFVVIDFK